MTPLAVAAAVSLLLFWPTGRLGAAEISNQQLGSSEIGLVTLNGVIGPEDASAFASAIGSHQKAVVVLNSEGGAVLPALEMGKRLRIKGLATAVPQNALCASACALLWLAGSPRFMGQGAKIGFHAAYIRKNGALLENGTGNALIGAYLDQLGLRESAIAYVTNAPPEGMEWLDASTARAVGIDFQVLEQNAAANDRPSADVGSGGDSYNPLATAKAFYYALGAGDGEMASAFVVPEKRGIGAFNEINMTNYFGSMRKPLRVLASRLVSSDVVAVDYSYVAKSGRECAATAVVTTAFEQGKTLIKSIKAKC